MEGSWAHPDEPASVYELKAYVWAVLQRLGLNFRDLVMADGKSDLFAKSLAITDRNGRVYVEFGVLKKKLMPELGQEVFYADFAWDVLMKKARKTVVSFTEIGRFPAVSRDLALLVDKDVTFSAIEQVARACEKKLLKGIRLFDVYEGKNLEPGKKSYAVNFTLQDEARTMNDRQTDAIMQKLIANLEKKLGAKLR